MGLRQQGGSTPEGYRVLKFVQSYERGVTDKSRLVQLGYHSRTSEAVAESIPIHACHK